MSPKTSLTSKKSAAWDQNTLESIKNIGSSSVKDSLSGIKNIGSNTLDQVFGNYYDLEDKFEQYGFAEAKKSVPKQKVEFKIFNYQEHFEAKKIKQEIKQLHELIIREIEMLKRADKNLLNEVKDVQKVSIESLPNKPGVYHVRFLEVILGILRVVRAKVSESCTWLEALKTKKKKRGSLFAALSKKKGTQYSLSNELQTARSVQ
jgi:hypothetical protein